MNTLKIKMSFYDVRGFIVYDPTINTQGITIANGGGTIFIHEEPMIRYVNLMMEMTGNDTFYARNFLDVKNAPVKEDLTKTIQD